MLGNLGRPQRSNVNRIVNHSVVEHPLPCQQSPISAKPSRRPHGIQSRESPENLGFIEDECRFVWRKLCHQVKDMF